MPGASNILLSIFVGVCLGLAGAAPLLFVMHLAVKAARASQAEGEVAQQAAPREGLSGQKAAQHAPQPPSIQMGFAAIVVSALIVMAGIYAIYVTAPSNLVLDATVAVLFMLALVLVFGLTAWHALVTSRRIH